jgi:succinate dehydrogenase flavin-adding protein (antitoxin of CptAB toxin-antitoxin module)|tara:strand:- start:1395 stop:1631 length:237 start_codon:yes stop_codon:yes gene_type:complete
MESDLTFKKLNFKARRGMKETTEILKRIFAEYKTLSKVQKEELEDLLNLNDQEIFDLIFKQRDAFENKFSSLKNFLYE